MSQPGQSQADVTAVTIEALRENAQRLGLVWLRRLATVNDGSESAAVVATFDGDSEAVPMVSMIGPLATDQRVYVDIVPPGANFIVGTAGDVEAVGVRARVTGQAVTSGAVTTLTWDALDEQVGAVMLGVPSTLITFSENGIWALHVQISSAAAVNAVRNLLQILMTVQTITGQPTQPARSVYVNGETIISVSLTTRFNAGDQFAVQMFQNTAVSPATVTAWLSCYKVAP